MAEFVDRKEHEEYVDSWLIKEDLEFTDIDNKSSIKTNFLITWRNFFNLQRWLAGLKLFLKHFRDMIDVDSIVAEVLEKLREQKTTIPVYYSMDVGQISTYTDEQVSMATYAVRRVDSYHIEITNKTKPNWIVDKLMVTVKNFDGTIVYPVVKTIGSKIDIYFTDGISTNYNIFLI